MGSDPMSLRRIEDKPADGSDKSSNRVGYQLVLVPFPQASCSRLQDASQPFASSDDSFEKVELPLGRLQYIPPNSAIKSLSQPLQE